MASKPTARPACAARRTRRLTPREAAASSAAACASRGRRRWRGGDGLPRPSSGRSACPPSQGRWADALRPAWAIWMPNFLPAEPAAAASTRAQWPASSFVPIEAEVPWVMRPGRSTAVASTTPDRPRTSRAIQVLQVPVAAGPSSAEYWHIGATTMRLGSVSGPIASGENRVAWVMDPYIGRARRPVQVNLFSLRPPKRSPAGHCWPCASMSPTEGIRPMNRKSFLAAAAAGALAFAFGPMTATTASRKGARRPAEHRGRGGGRERLPGRMPASSTP